MVAYRLYLFGAPRLEYKQKTVPIDTRKALAMLAYLIIEGQPQSRDTLAALLWPESAQKAARAALRRTLSTLRSSMDDSLLDFGREMISINPGDGLWCDVSEFQAHLDECRTHEHAENEVCPQCLQPLKSAAELYTASFMAGFSLRDTYEFDDWQFMEADRLTRQFANVLEKLVTLETSGRNLDTAIELAKDWMALDRLHEPPHQALMKIFAMNGQRSTALRQYRQCMEILEEELGVQPLEETTAIYHRILEGADFARPEVPEIRQVKNADAKTKPDPGAASRELIGRQAETHVLQTYLDQISEDGKVVAVVGEAGIGKTFLVKEFVSTKTEQSAFIFAARGYRSEDNRPYGVWVDGLRAALKQPGAANRLAAVSPHWLAEVARLLPEINSLVGELPSQSSSEGPGAQGRLFEGLRQMIIALSNKSSPGIIWLDDLNWADQASIDLLAYLTRNLAHLPVLIALCWRDNSNPQATALSRIIQDVEKDNAGTQILLDTLGSEEIIKLSQSLLPPDAPPNFVEQVVKLSEGLPFFVVEYCALAKNQNWDQGISLPIPKSIFELERARIQMMDETSSQVLTTAAVIGRSFSLDVLRDASGRADIEVVNGVENLIHRQLVYEKEQDGVITYDFNHGLLREVVYQEISLARRRLLHRRVAEALYKNHRRYPKGDQWLAQIAFHYRRAGEDEQAAEYYLQAGDHARAVYANVEALEHYQNALTLGYPEKALLREAIGDLSTLQGDYQSAISNFEITAVQSESADLPRIEHKLGNVHKRMENWELAIAHYQAALDIDQTIEALKAAILVGYSYCISRLEDYQLARELAQNALKIARSGNHLEELAQANNVLGILSRELGEIDQAMIYFNEVLKIAARNDLISEEIAGLNNLSFVYRSKQDYSSAVECSEKALLLCRKIGDRHREAALLNNLADIYHAAGQEKKSMDNLKQAVMIFTQIGMGQEVYIPEVWMMTDW